MPGAVEVRIVKEDHIAAIELPGGPGGDPLGGCELAPILAPAGPEQGFQARGSGRVEAGGTVDAIRRPVPGRRDAHGILDHPGAPLQIGRDLGSRHAELKAVPVAVEGHEMSSAVNPGRQLRATLDLLADEEEHGRQPRPGEDLEHGRRAFGVRAVVEGERDSERIRQATGQVEAVRRGREDGR